MFEPTSRYYARKTTTYTGPDGRRITYLRRRFLPRAEELTLLLEETVNDGDRLDTITARTLGDPEQFWRIADGNDAMNPFDLTDEPGALVRVPVPRVET